MESVGIMYEDALNRTKWKNDIQYRFSDPMRWEKPEENNTTGIQSMSRSQQDLTRLPSTPHLICQLLAFHESASSFLRDARPYEILISSVVDWFGLK